MVTFLFFLLIISVPVAVMCAQYKHLITTSAVAATAENRGLKSANKLGMTLIADDGQFFACAGKNLFAFNMNGSVEWVVPMHYECRLDISPVSDDEGQIYLVAEDRLLKITPSNIRSSRPVVSVLFGENSEHGGSGEIIGIAISILYTSIFVTVKNRGLFALLLRGEFLWSAGPVLYRFGYRQGCKDNITDCYFSSAPVVDQCEGTLYVSNTEGQLYSLYIRSPHFRWIQDFSSVDYSLRAIPGNNGQVFVVFLRKALVSSVDVCTGNLLWQATVGPLSMENCLPVIDSNGWLSIASLDGFLYSISPTGESKKLLQASAPDSVILVSPVPDCSGFAIYVSQTVMETKSTHTTGDNTLISALMPKNIIFTLLAPATGNIYWTASYQDELSSLLSESDLHYFEVDERILLNSLAARRIGSNLQCFTTRHKVAWTCAQANPKFFSIDAGNERGILLFLFFQLVILIALGVLVRFCCMFWKKKKLKEHGLRRFLDKRQSLHNKRKTLSRMITKLEAKAVEDATDNKALQQLGEIVRAKEGVERKLLTSYSLGRDTSGSNKESILPLYDGNMKSFSFHSARKESVTIFNTYSEMSSSSEESRNYSGYGSDDSQSSISSYRQKVLRTHLDQELTSKSKGVVEDDDHSSQSSFEAAERYFREGTSASTSASIMFDNPMFIEQQVQSNEAKKSEELNIEPMHGSFDKRRMWLKRRRTLSSTD